MAQVKLTKTQLRIEQGKLRGFRYFLPTLRLKKALLQQEINEARTEQRHWSALVERQWENFQRLAPLFSTSSFNPLQMVFLGHVERTVENIAGVEVPKLAALRIDVASYSRLDTPVWLDGVLAELGMYREAQVRAQIAAERAEALERELRQVSIRVNLFEKVLIPRAEGNIRKITIFLGDQQLTAIGRAKIAKSKKAVVQVVSCV